MALGFERAVVEILEDAGLGSWAAETLKIGEMPPTPNDCSLILLDGGGPPINVVMEVQQITVITRRESYEAALEDAKAAHTVLHEYQGYVRGIRIANITANFLPVSLGRDLDGDGGRWRQTQTFTATTRRYAFS
jgi:hypothetical protein